MNDAFLSLQRQFESAAARFDLRHITSTASLVKRLPGENWSPGEPPPRGRISFNHSIGIVERFVAKALMPGCRFQESFVNLNWRAGSGLMVHCYLFGPRSNFSEALMTFDEMASFLRAAIVDKYGTKGTPFTSPLINHGEAVLSLAYTCGTLQKLETLSRVSCDISLEEPSRNMVNIAGGRWSRRIPKTPPRPHPWGDEPLTWQELFAAHNDYIEELYVMPFNIFRVLSVLSGYIAADRVDMRKTMDPEIFEVGFFPCSNRGTPDHTPALPWVDWAKAIGVLDYRTAKAKLESAAVAGKPKAKKVALDRARLPREYVDPINKYLSKGRA